MKLEPTLRYGDLVRNPVTGSVGMFLAAPRDTGLRPMDVLCLSTDPALVSLHPWDGKIKRVYGWELVDG